jgi:hypothetical protein
MIERVLVLELSAVSSDLILHPPRISVARLSQEVIKRDLQPVEAVAEVTDMLNQSEVGVVECQTETVPVKVVAEVLQILTR